VRTQVQIRFGGLLYFDPSPLDARKRVVVREHGESRGVQVPDNCVDDPNGEGCGHDDTSPACTDIRVNTNRETSDYFQDHSTRIEGMSGHSSHKLVTCTSDVAFLIDRDDSHYFLFKQRNMRRRSLQNEGARA
jgi:hypothetical protein